MPSLTSISSHFNQAVDAYKKANKQAADQPQSLSKDQSTNQADGLGVLHDGDRIDIIKQGTAPQFSDIIQEVITENFQKIKKSEQSAMDAIKGKANMIEVMAAINESEITLQEIVTIRDKIVSAYLDILKMPL